MLESQGPWCVIQEGEDWLAHGGWDSAGLGGACGERTTVPGASSSSLARQPFPLGKDQPLELSLLCLLQGTLPLSRHTVWYLRLTVSMPQHGLRTNLFVESHMLELVAAKILHRQVHWNQNIGSHPHFAKTGGFLFTWNSRVISGQMRHRYGESILRMIARA